MCVFELPRDGDGNVQPHNHPSLDGDARLIRRVHEDWVVPDGNTGGQRLSSAIFKHDPRQGRHLSFDSENCITAKGVDPAVYVTTPKWFGSLILSVSALRSTDKAQKPEDEWRIGMIPVEGNDCHAGLWGKISEGQSKSLQRLSEWLVEIPDVHKLAPDA